MKLQVLAVQALSMVYRTVLSAPFISKSELIFPFFPGCISQRNQQMFQATEWLLISTFQSFAVLDFSIKGLQKLESYISYNQSKSDFAGKFAIPSIYIVRLSLRLIGYNLDIQRRTGLCFIWIERNLMMWTSICRWRWRASASAIRFSSPADPPPRCSSN